jgi:hypothetical protein
LIDAKAISSETINPFGTFQGTDLLPYVISTTDPESTTPVKESTSAEGVTKQRLGEICDCIKDNAWVSTPRRAMPVLEKLAPVFYRPVKP